MVVCKYMNPLRRLTAIHASLLRQKSLIVLPFTAAQRLNENTLIAKGALLTTPHVPLLREV